MTGKTNDKGARRVQWTPGDTFRLDLVGQVECPPAWQGRVHAHPFVEVVLACEGSGTVLCGSRSTRIVRDDVLVIASGVSHRFASSKEVGLTLFYAGFTSDLESEFVIKANGRLGNPAAAAAIRDGFKTIVRDMDDLQGLLQGHARQKHLRCFAPAGRVARYRQPSA